MPKKRVAVSLRKPAPESARTAAAAAAPEADSELLNRSAAAPAEAEVMSVEAFVNGAAVALEQALGARPSELRELLRRGPDGLRELSIFLPEQLARDLALHCREHDLDPSGLVARALERYLNGAGAVPGEIELRKTARALLGELARRARSYWLVRRGVARVPRPA